MDLLTFITYLAIGRLLTWLLQTNGLTQPLWHLHPKLTELGQCDLCAGFWVYLALGLFLPAPFQVWPWLAEVIILAAFTTFTAHLLRLGWLAKFGTVIID